MSNNESWKHRETVAAHYRQELSDTQTELDRTNRVLEIAREGLECIRSNGKHFGGTWCCVQAAGALALIKKELGE
jgi:hypothetical protein